ncbi:MAG TPA: hypothetical protein VGM89_12260 [Puia sp.]
MGSEHKIRYPSVAKTNTPFFSKEGNGNFFGNTPNVQAKCESCEKEEQLQKKEDEGPAAEKGMALLAHEVTHTIQQTGMVQRAPDCSEYDTGEVTKSRSTAGWLDPDVLLVKPGELLIADFPIGASNVGKSVTADPVFTANLAQWQSDCAFRFVITGFSDCIGVEARNVGLRQARALKVEQLLGAATKTRISFRGMAALGQFITGNDTPENRAKNRSAKLEFRKGFFAQYEALDNAAASEAKIQEALVALSASNEIREKNVPDYITKLGITLEALTPRHDADVATPAYPFFTGKTNYATTVTLSGSVRFYKDAAGTHIAIPVRQFPCVDPFLSVADISERIVQAVTEVAHLNTTGGAAAPAFEVYRSKFQGWWNIAPFNTMSDFFDPALNSKGPRTPRSRAVFEKVYNEDAAVKSAYDLNTAGARDKIDTYLGPDALNLINSARLNELKKAFDAHAAPVTAADLPAFKAAIVAAAANLDANDIDSFNKSGEWQRLVARYVTTEALRTEITNLIRTSAPVPVAPLPVPGPVAPGPAAGGAKGFLQHIRIDGPVVPVASNLEKEPVTLTPKSDRNNPGLAFTTKMTVSPAIKVVGPNVSPLTPWPAGGAVGTPFLPQIAVNGVANMIAHLDLEGLPPALSAGLAVPDLPFTINDNRLPFVSANWTMNFTYTTGAGSDWFTNNPNIRYEHGAQNFGLSAFLGQPNPGLTLRVQGRVKRGGVVIASKPDAMLWPSGANNSPALSLPFAPPAVIPVGGDPLTVEVDLLDSAGAVIGQKVTNVNVLAPAVYTQADAITEATKDANDLNSPAFLGQMTALGGLAARVATAIQTPDADGGIVLRPITIRHDSDAYVTAAKGPGHPELVGYFLGTSYANSAAWNSGAAAMSIPPYFGFGALGNRMIVANRTTDVANKIKRPDAELIPEIVHEAVHAMDLPFSAADLDKYKSEFRAYWEQGDFGPPNQMNCPPPAGNCKEAAFDPSMPPPGPQSPRARAIFDHMYGTNSYDYVKKDYDANTGGFRDVVDHWLIPDGINLIASVRIERLRMLVTAYAGANFADTRSKIAKMMGNELPAPAGGAMDGDEKHEITSNRAWRELVEAKFTVPAERTTIKGELGIPL